MATLKYKDSQGNYRPVIGYNVTYENEVVQTTGTSTTAVMSQNAVTDALADKADVTALPSVMIGATALADGISGLVPTPTTSDVSKYLKGDGTWSEVALPSTMTGASSSAAGASGLVPAPAAGDQGKFLKGDGSWGAINTSDIEVLEGYFNKTTANNQIIFYAGISNPEKILGVFAYAPSTYSNSSNTVIWGSSYGWFNDFGGIFYYYNTFSLNLYNVIVARFVSGDPGTLCYRIIKKK